MRPAIYWAIGASWFDGRLPAATHEGRPRSVSRAAPELVLAMILHGAYNAAATSLNWPGLMF